MEESLYVPLAVNCASPPALDATAVAGVTVTEVSLWSPHPKVHNTANSRIVVAPPGNLEDIKTSLWERTLHFLLF